YHVRQHRSCIAKVRKKEEGRRKREERRGRKATLARKKPLFPADIHPWVYTNDINGHDII
ncbi:hypothetical protein, partial [Okeania sp. SIO2C9]|uniref:hypothetical protein n=1 Tax=Okeania sp. SIO2C9 TaxID=2607791 RepID=UPI0025CFE02E